MTGYLAETVTIPTYSVRMADIIEDWNGNYNQP